MNTMHAIDKAKTPMNTVEIKTGFSRMALLLMLALPLSSAAAEQQTFASPETAVDAVAAALKANDETALVAIFGERHKKLVITGDPAHDAAARAEAAERLTAFHALEERGNDRVLLIGAEAWPFPIPLRLENGSWRFVTEEGADELLNRRIGRNERNAIDVQRAYLDSQRQYASRDRNGDGVLQYAQKLASTPGKQDGLYWPAEEARNEEASPFGPLVAGGSAYLSGRRKGDPYRGYHFRILTGQGENAPGGTYRYIINGRMIAGFAMVAYPARYGDSGVMTFIVNHNGKVYEKDLGENTKNLGARMTSFNPGKGWKEVAP